MRISLPFLLLSVAITLLSLPVLSARGDTSVDALSESESMRRCPVEGSQPVPPTILQAARVTGDVSSQSIITVPLHIHILQTSRGSNPTSPEMVAATVARLNAGFSKAGFRFQVQSLETVVNDSWAEVSKSNLAVLDDASAALNVGSRDSANMYFSSLEGLCGIAALPYAEDPYESIFLDYRCIPGGTLSDSYDTVIHEMGHFMGLFHTFAPEPNGCRGKGDFVSDTPYQKTPHFQCRRYDTCPRKPGTDPVRNYMDYTGDSCGHRFSRGQISLMRSAHTYYRIN
jgi:hypothetical protein